MPREYSLYEAKAKLSALVRQVREGATIVITVHGEPAAELRAIEPASTTPTNQSRHEDLQARGLLTPAKCSPHEYAALLKRKRAKASAGALARFLSERD